MTQHGKRNSPAGAAIAFDRSRALIDDLNYCGTKQRGYLIMTITADAVKGEYVFVCTVKSSAHSASVGKTITVAATGAVT